MRFAAICAAHSPLVTHPGVISAKKGEFLSLMEAAGKWAEEFDPEVIIEFGPDHFNGFFYDKMPNFCMGLEAVSIGDWGTTPGAIDVPAAVARPLLEAVRRSDVDLDMSHRMELDHGFTQTLELMFGELNRFPLIPIMINCAAAPLPPLRRARLLGEAVGKYFRFEDKRVLFLASGGLSHDPPTLKWENADEEAREIMLGRRRPTEQSREARKAKGVAASKETAAGRGTARPLNPEWDSGFIELLASGRLEDVDAWNEEQVSDAAGSGGQEIRTWVAAFAALSAASGRYSMEHRYYEAVPEWITGMGIVRAS